MHPYLESTPPILSPDIRVSHYTKSHSYPTHFHNNVEIVYCFSGKQKVILGSTLFTVEEGEAMIIFPNVVHGYIRDEADEPTESLMSICSLSYLSKLFPEFTTHRPLSPLIPAVQVPESAISALREMCTAEGNKLLAWAILALSDLFPKLELIPAKYSDGFSLAPTLIAYIDANFQKPLTIKYLATQFGYSSSYITGLFYSQLKIPFRTYLGNVRSEYAANLIRTTTKNLAEISDECGYTSTNTFSRNFKRCFSMTPSEYKKSLSDK